jgi:septal ring factor EnvC (AmiA/AmiB activator)
MTVELLNPSTGEVVTLEEHLGAAQALEADIGKLDRAIASTKEELKDMKVARETSVKKLRATVREIRVLSSARGQRRSTRSKK